jgi:hypothetical protein
MTRLISGKIKKTPSANADPNRYSWLDLQNAEPDLGVPSSNGSLFVSSTTGNRSWTDTITISGSVATINTLTVIGNSNLGSNSNVRITGGGPGQFIVTDGAGNLAWSSAAISTASGISNEQSSVAIVAPNGNISMAVAGTLNVVVVSNTGAIVNGNITANTGVFTGNGSGLSAITGANVTGTVPVAATATTAGTVTTNAQPNITSVGTLTSLGVSGNITAANITAANITANTGIFTGNGSGLTSLTGGNVTGTVANAAFATSAGNATSAGTATSATTAGTVTTNAQSNITSVGTLTGLNVTGNANINGTTIDTSGNITAPFVFANVIGNVSGNITISGSNGEVLYNNEGNSGTSNAFSFNDASNVLTVTGNIGANFFTGNGSALSSITGANVTGAVAFATTANSVAGANVTGTVANATFATTAGSATTAGTVTTNAQPNITSVGTLTGLSVNGNITAANITANTGVFTGNGSGLSAIAGANVTGTVASAATAATVTTNAQPNITSVGTLTGLGVNGNVTAANIIANTGVFTGNGSGLSAIAGANVTGTVANATFATSAGTAGTVTTAAQPNITSLGTLSNLNVSGNTIISGNLTVDGNLVYVNVDTLSVEDPIIQLQTGPNGGAPVANSGKDVGTALNYYDTQARVAFMGWDVSNTEFGLASQASITNEVVTFTSYGNLRVANIIGNGQALTSLTGANVTGAVAFATTANTVAGANVTGTVANATFATTAGSATTAGTVTTNAQPNITSVGILTGLTVGNIAANTIFGNGTINAAGNITAPFFFGNVQGNISGNFAVTGSNGEVIFNKEGNAGSSNGFTFNTSSNVLTVAGNVSATNFIGNGAALTALNASNVSTGTLAQARLANSNVILGSTTLALGTTTTTIAGLTSVTSTTFVGALTGAATTAGSVTTNSQGNITSVGTLTSLGVSGAITAANIIANTGIFAGNGSGLSAIAGANVTGAVAFATTANAVAGANVSGTVSSATTAGTVTTAAQPNITSVGTLTSLTVSGNLSSGNANLGNTAVANFFVGDGTQLINLPISTSLANGTSNINISTANGNVNTSVGGAANVLIIAATGANIAGTLNASGNANVSNLGTGRVIATGNISGTQLISNVATGTAPLVVTSTTQVANLNVATAGSATTAGTVTTNAQPNITSTGTLTGLTVGNITANTVFGNGTINAAGNITAPFVFANVVGNISGNFAVTGSNGEVIFNKEGNAGSSNGFTFNNTTNALSVTGTINATGNANVLNLGTTRVIATGNISGTQLISNIAVGTAPLVVTSTTRVANLNVANAGFADAATTAGTVTTNAQPNITSVGILTGLTVGNIAANTIFGNGTINAAGNITAPFFFGNVSGNISGNFAVTGSNGEVIFNKEGNAGSSNAFTFNNTTNALSVTGNITGSNLVTGGIVSATGNVTTSANLVTNLIVGRTTGITITATGTNQNITLAPTGTGIVDVNSKILGNLATPVAATDAATKAYVDGVAEGLTVKSACKAATTGTLAIESGGTITYNNGTSGVGATLTTTGSYIAIDGVTLANGDRILVKNEATAANNGIYVRTSTTVLTRATDFDNSPDGEVAGAFTFITNGSTNADAGFVCTTNNPVVMGTTAITFTQFSGAGTYTAGTGLTLTGSIFSITNTTVTAGAYGNGDRVATFTVNSQGQLTVAANTAITANAANLTGTTLNSGIVNSSLTSVGTLGSLAVTANITSGNANLGNAARANFFIGDGSQLTNIPIGTSLTNGTSSVAIPTINGNINLTATGNTTLVVTGTGANITGTLNATGNANVLNLGTVRVIATGNISSGNANLGNLATANFFAGDGSQLTNIPTGTTLSNGTSSVNIPTANGNINITRGGVANVVVITGTGVNVAGTLNTGTGNITSGNANLGNAVIANFFLGDGSQLTGVPGGQAIINGTSNVAIPTVNGNVSISVGGSSNRLVVTTSGANITGTLGVSGNANVNNLGTGTALITTGNITTINSGLLQNGTSNVVVAASGGNVTLGVDGTDRITATTTGANVTGTLGVSGNANVGNIGATNGAFTNISGTLTTAAQPNITSVGTLTSLAMSGLITGASSISTDVNVANDSGSFSARGNATTVASMSFHRTGAYAINMGLGVDNVFRIGGWSASNNAFQLTGAGALTILSTMNAPTVQTTALTTGANTTAGTVTGNWTLTAGSRWQATYADLAERYVADEAYEPGTVVVLGGENEVTIENVVDSHKVAGVVTTNPAYIMNAELEGENVVEVALIGRVPCKVVGPVNKGDLLTTATIPGYAYANNAASAGRIVGKSLENFNGELGIVEIMVGKT